MPAFKDATHAFEHYFKRLVATDDEYKDTKVLFNERIILFNPENRIITTPWRKFSQSYAEREWEWYMTGTQDVTEIAKYAPMWNKMHRGDGRVWSNYGYWWKRNDQLERVISMLQEDHQTRRAVIVHYSPDDMQDFTNDTPCNVVLNFYIVDGFLNLTVFARSIDIWFGFCNDQYQFSKLMELVGKRLSKPLGLMTYMITNLHLYKNQLNNGN